jgi:hypothetical protein
MFSIYHFFAHLINHSTYLRNVAKLEEFAFDDNMLSCRNMGKFPDLTIRLNTNTSDLRGGELIELKDSKGYSVSSFNSTIPTGKKQISSLITSANDQTYLQMTKAGDDVYSLPERDVFYLVRGRKQNHVKVCLVHGSFFETISPDQLIQQAFAQVFDESASGGQLQMTEEERAKLVALFSQRETFSKVRDVQKASVKLRFRIMTEAKAEGNILNTRKYPQIVDDTLNLLVPYHTEAEQQHIGAHTLHTLGQAAYSHLKVFVLRHLLNGPFLVFQSPLV